ncbi:MAG: hypothetical protein KDB68_02065 [Planctomycetes bacterium]|nr:hypothetical protein [Planctomycetota bacterium]
MKSFIIPPLGKTSKNNIPYEERLKAYARIAIDGEDANVVAEELYTKHGLKVPKHGKQAFSAFRRLLERKIKEQHTRTLELLEEYGFEAVDVSPPAESDPTTPAESEVVEDEVEEALDAIED